MLSLDRLMSLGQKGNLELGPLDRLAALARRPADRIYEARAGRLSDLATLRALPSGGVGGSGESTPGPRVLVTSLRGWSTHSAVEIVIAHALRMRGASVAVLTCGGGMPACEVGWARRAHPRPCDRCAWFTDRLGEQSGLERFALRDFLPWGADVRRAPDGADDREAIRRSRISLTWLMRATRIDDVPDGPQAREDFAVAAAGVGQAAAKILERFEPDVVFLLNGLFGAERTIRDVALALGMQAPTYEIAPRAGTLVLSQDVPAPYYDTDALWSACRGRSLSDGQRRQVLALLEDRARGVGAHERYFESPEEDLAELRRRLRLTDGRRVVTLFTNLSWDSAAVDRDVGFGSMFEWIVEAVRLAGERGDLVLVVRVHPAELSWGTREDVQTEIVRALGGLPDNVRLVPPGEALSSYALIGLSDLVLTYTTTVGLEAAARGKPVAVAGETHYRGRGFTLDIGGAEELGQVLAKPPDPLDDRSVDLALRYAFTFFFRGMVPFRAVQAMGGRVTRVPSSVEELAPGRDPHLDWICDRILDGEDFGLPDRLASGDLSPIAEAVT